MEKKFNDETKKIKQYDMIHDAKENSFLQFSNLIYKDRKNQ